MSKEIIGTWRSDPADVGSQEAYGNVSMEFTAGDLIYTIHTGDKDQKMFLTYKIEGSLLVTDQPSHPKREETRF